MRRPNNVIVNEIVAQERPSSRRGSRSSVGYAAELERSEAQQARVQIQEERREIQKQKALISETKQKMLEAQKAHSVARCVKQKAEAVKKRPSCLIIHLPNSSPTGSSPVLSASLRSFPLLSSPSDLRKSPRL